MRPIYLISKTPYVGVIHIPILTIRFLSPVIDFSDYEGVIITSKQSLLALKKYTFNRDRLHCICVSESTANSAEKEGFKCVEIAEGYGKTIPKVLSSKERRGKWLYIRPKVVASSWVEDVRALGIVMDEAIVYETSCNENISHSSIDNSGVLIFTSPSSVECFHQKFSILPTHTVVVIGKTTQQSLPLGIESQCSSTTSIESAVELARQIALKG